MGLLSHVAGAVLAISVVVFAAFFGRLPLFRHTPVAFLHRLLTIHLPTTLSRLDQRLTCGLLTSGLSRFFRHAMYGRHPTVLIFFIALLVGGQVLYLPGAWPQMSLFHRGMSTVAMALPYWFLWRAAGDPGVITARNVRRFEAMYPYDYALFHPGATCRTCGIGKPARSKHCSVCNRCVARMDHHCVFINNCVGAHNHRSFLLLLLTTAFLTLYGGLLGLSLLTATIRHRLPRRYHKPAAAASWSIFKPAATSWPEWSTLLTLGIQTDVGLGSVTLLCLLISPLIWGLLAYHGYLIYCGTTTNESMKWQDWAFEIELGCAFRRPLDTGSQRPEDRESHPGTGNKDAQDAAEEHASRPTHVLVRTENGFPPPRDDPELPGTGPWERVEGLAEVENLYDLGFWENLADVCDPGYGFETRVAGTGKGVDLERGRGRGRGRGKGRKGRKRGG